MFSTRSFRALLGAAIAPLFIAALITFGTGQFAEPGSAAGDCTVDPSLDSEEQAFLALINNHRTQNGLAPLSASYLLSKAAQWKSQDMANNNYFAHDDLTRTWVTRIRDCGYGYNTWMGENIFAGAATAQQAFDAWRNSSGHNANMLNANYTAVGIGRAYRAGSPYGWYWTTDFGGYADAWPGGVPTATPAVPTATRTSTPPAPTATRTSTPPAPTATRTSTPPAPTATRTATPPAPAATPTSGTATTLHVSDLDGSTSGKGRWTARVTVWVHSGAHQPVAGATVTGLWGGTRSSSCVTDAAGRCSVQSQRLSASTASVSFAVTGVSKTGAGYAPAGNHDVDGSSNGTTITVAH